MLDLASVLANGNSDAFQTAIVTTIGVIVAAGLTAFATTFQRSRDASPAPTPKVTVTPDVMDGMVQAYIHSLEADRALASRERDNLRRKYTHLRDACWERGIDPDELEKGET